MTTWSSPWRRFRRGKLFFLRLTQSPSFSSSGKHGIGSILDDAGDGKIVLHRVRSSSKLRACKTFAAALETAAAAVAGESRVVLYFTSLRAVRPTFEGCREVRAILSGLRVAVDERDVSMDAAYLAEVRTLLREDQPDLPQLFVCGRLVGGAEEVRLLHESGELRRVVAGAQELPPAPCASPPATSAAAATAGSARRPAASASARRETRTASSAAPAAAPPADARHVIDRRSEMLDA